MTPNDANGARGIKAKKLGDDEDAPRHFEYYMTMTPDVIDKK